MVLPRCQAGAPTQPLWSLCKTPRRFQKSHGELSPLQFPVGQALLATYRLQTVFAKLLLDEGARSDMKLRMLNDTVLVRPDKESEIVSDNPEIERIIREGVIQIPEIAQGFWFKAPRRGEVVTSGPDCKYHLQPGDRVVFTRFGGVPFTWQDEQLRMMREYEVLAKEEPELVDVPLPLDND